MKGFVYSAIAINLSVFIKIYILESIFIQYKYNISIYIMLCLCKYIYIYIDIYIYKIQHISLKLETNSGPKSLHCI